MKTVFNGKLNVVSAALLLSISALSSAAFAQGATTKEASAKPVKAADSGYSLDNLPAVLKNAQKGTGLQIKKTFPAQSGLQGWLVKQSNESREAVIYTTADGDLLIAGMLMTVQGENLTSKYSEEHIPKPDYSEAFKAFQKDSEYVTLGDKKAKAEVFVLFDPNCGYCKVIHRLLAPSIDAGELKVHYVPVGILGPTSVDKSAALLESSDPAGYIAKAVSGTASADKAKNKATEAKVQANNELMRKYGFTGTPAVLYSVKGPKGETVQVSMGLPNMPNLFSQLGISGKMDLLKMQPDLAQYIR